MNNYIQINNEKYSVNPDWMPEYTTPGQARPTLSGRIDAIFSAHTLMSFSGTIIVPVTSPGSGWGDISDFRGVYSSTAATTFSDHYGNGYNIMFTGQIPERSLTNMWDAASNEFHIPVNIVILSEIAP